MQEDELNHIIDSVGRGFDNLSSLDRKEALYDVALDFEEEPLFDARIRNEVAHRRHNNEDIHWTQFFQICAKSLTLQAASKFLEKVESIGVCQDYLKEIQINVKLFKFEMLLKCLVDSQHDPKDIAEAIYPLESDKKPVDAIETELAIAKTMDIVLPAARELCLPAFTAILEARRASAVRTSELLATRHFG